MDKLGRSTNAREAYAEAQGSGQIKTSKFSTGKKEVYN